MCRLLVEKLNRSRDFLNAWFETKNELPATYDLRALIVASLGKHTPGEIGRAFDDKTAVHQH